eukprot:182177_1
MIQLYFLVLLFIINQDSGDSVCISGSISSAVDGKYEYFYWNSDLNATVYHNRDSNQYLEPYMHLDQNNASYQYRIVPNYPYHNQSSIICFIEHSDNAYTISINDCQHNWSDDINQTWVTNPNMMLVNCNDICAFGDFAKRYDIQGTYSWHHFDYTWKSSVYYCNGCANQTYLSGKQNHYWSIKTNQTYYYGSYWSIKRNGANIASCFLGYLDTHYMFNLDHCEEWKFFGRIDDTMRVGECTQYPLPTDTQVYNFSFPQSDYLFISSTYWSFIGPLYFFMTVWLCYYTWKCGNLERFQDGLDSSFQTEHDDSDRESDSDEENVQMTNIATTNQVPSVSDQVQNQDYDGH